MNKVYIVLGPTASGKSGLAIELAKDINGEIISADSMQIYKYMDIGTAKVTPEETQGIKHYLIDEVYPDEDFSVARFKDKAEEYLELILDKGKMPVIAGGTGLYINSLVYNIDFAKAPMDSRWREELTKEADEKGIEELYERLKKIDPESWQRLHLNDNKRIIRALEVYYQTGETMTEQIRRSREVPSKYKFVLIGLNMDRSLLYDRIDRRVDKMFENGLVQEVEKLVEMGYDKNTIAMQAIGYKEVLAYLRKEITFDEAVYIIKRDSRHYAKRQITWFKRLEKVNWIDVYERDNSQILLKKSKKILLGKE